MTRICLPVLISEYAMAVGGRQAPPPAAQTSVASGIHCRLQATLTVWMIADILREGLVNRKAAMDEVGVQNTACIE